MALFEKTVVPQEQFAARVREALGHMTELLIEKNRMYGGASMDMGMTGVYVHIHDKDTRIRSLLEKQAAGEPLSFESLEDTLRDIIGYATIGLVIQAAQQGTLPVERFELALHPSMGAEEHLSMFLHAIKSDTKDPLVFGQRVGDALKSWLKRNSDDRFLRDACIGLNLTEE